MPTLFLLSGKIAAGKSTRAIELKEKHRAILISQDEWMSKLYPGEIQTLQDYVEKFSRLQHLVKPHVVQLLQNHQNIVLDFPANTKKVRAWMKTIIDESGCDHELHYLNESDEECLKRLKWRNENTDHPYKTSEDEFHQFTEFFEEPNDEEGFKLF